MLCVLGALSVRPGGCTNMTNLLPPRCLQAALLALTLAQSLTADLWLGLNAEVTDGVPPGQGDYWSW